MSNVRSFVFLVPFALTTPAAAQAATISGVVLTPSSMTASSGGGQATATLPAGPLAANGAVTATLGGLASVEWSGFAVPTRLQYQVTHTATAPFQAASATVSPTDILLQLANPSVIAVQLELRAVVHSAGAATQSFAVDVGNDGTVELAASSPTRFLAMPLTLGPVPLFVRLSGAVAVSGTGQTWVQLEVSALPTANVITTTAILGCDPGHEHLVQPRFDGGVDFVTTAPLLFANPRVLVLGLGTQLLALPSSQPFPCLLLPRPDLLAFMQPSQRFTLALPPAVRPVTVWSQGVVLDPSALQTTNAIRTDAY